MKKFNSICVFCGANAGNQPHYVAAAVAMGKELAAQGFNLVYGGGSVGLMGEVARTARDNGCTVIGIIPEDLTTKELMGYPIGELIVVATMHERKAKMAELSDAIVALPGGFGTLDELFEAITWGQIGLHHKPIGLLNVGGFFDLLIQYIDHCVDEGFIRPQHRQLFLVDDDPARLLERLATHQPPPGLVRTDGLERA
ncbi:MAG: TIGR00730 family Rossman fold protein [Caldilineaceae bacterium]|nr:TIGR00730 family Rossman fold protein [Caldilineaceae bacterium]